MFQEVWKQMPVEVAQTSLKTQQQVTSALLTLLKFTPPLHFGLLLELKVKI